MNSHFFRCLNPVFKGMVLLLAMAQLTLAQPSKSAQAMGLNQKFFIKSGMAAIFTSPLSGNHFYELAEEDPLTGMSQPYGVAQVESESARKKAMYPYTVSLGILLNQHSFYFDYLKFSKTNQDGLLLGFGYRYRFLLREPKLQPFLGLGFRYVVREQEKAIVQSYGVGKADSLYTARWSGQAFHLGTGIEYHWKFLNFGLGVEGQFNHLGSVIHSGQDKTFNLNPSILELMWIPRAEVGVMW
jgi:hypothetical protein